MRVRNFCAGPAAIPEPVLEEVRSELLEWGNAGMSIMEMSHRSSIFDEVASNDPIAEDSEAGDKEKSS